MLQIILMIVGIFVAVRRPTLRRLTSQDYPEVEPVKFAQWHTAQLTATDTFLWASWGSFFIVLGIALAARGMELTFEAAIAFRIVLVVGTVVWFVIAGIKSSNARKLRESVGIRWPK